MLLRRMQVLIATLWVGSLWTVGYLAAPTLFMTLPDKVLAGSIAGSLFQVQAWVSLACGVILLIAIGWVDTARDGNNRSLLLLVGGMLGCAALMHFGLHPLLAALRESATATGGVMTPDIKTKFGILHGLSSLVYLIESGLGVALVFKIR